ncbi:MAG: sulfite exporter TauE/SafE family protein [Deltaproteobacteria bacterium]|nr:sulfite exporter TauE/SafE family protein [Deltaproteobacteria bacterium]
MFEFLPPFLIGFVGSLHCLGMCGPLVLAYSLNLPGSRGEGFSVWRRGFLHHLAFHSGRILTYGFLGAAAAGVGSLIGFPGALLNLRGGVTLAGGCLMVLLGLVLLKILPLPLLPPPLGPGSFFGRLLPPLFRSPRPLSKMALGVTAGFLPCMLSFALLVKAATTQNLPGGFFTMILFGLGTAPALFLAGFSASFLSLKIRILGERTAALSVILMGLILVFKGAGYFA